MKRLSVKGYVQIVDDQSDDIKTRDVYMDKGGFLMDSRYPITTIVDLVVLYDLLCGISDHTLCAIDCESANRMERKIEPERINCGRR